MLSSKIHSVCKEQTLAICDVFCNILLLCLVANAMVTCMRAILSSSPSSSSYDPSISEAACSRVVLVRVDCALSMIIKVQVSQIESNRMRYTDDHTHTHTSKCTCSSQPRNENDLINLIENFDGPKLSGGGGGGGICSVGGSWYWWCDAVYVILKSNNQLASSIVGILVALDPTQSTHNPTNELNSMGWVLLLLVAFFRFILSFQRYHQHFPIAHDSIQAASMFLSNQNRIYVITAFHYFSARFHSYFSTAWMLYSLGVQQQLCSGHLLFRGLPLQPASNGYIIQYTCRTLKLVQ